MYKNINGDLLDSKEKLIVAIIHTANYEQVNPVNLGAYDDCVKLYGVSSDNFYVSNDFHDDPIGYAIGIKEWGFKDDSFSYEQSKL